MPIYNCPVIGNGSESDPFRPSISENLIIGRWEILGEYPGSFTIESRINIKVENYLDLSIIQDIHLVEI